MWILSLDECSGDSYGTYLMKCGIELREEVEEAVAAIIEDFNSRGDKEWSVEDIAAALENRGYANEYIESVHIDV